MAGSQEKLVALLLSSWQSSYKRAMLLYQVQSLLSKKAAPDLDFS